MVSARGFTIVELTIVIAIIAVLSGGVIAAINVPLQLQRARDGQRKTDLRSIQSALELFRSDNGCYPSASCAALTSFPACSNAFIAGASTYMQRIPCDPKNGTPAEFTYQYAPRANGYCIRTCLENTADAARDSTNNVVVASCTFATACSTGWSYTIENP